MAAKKWSKAVKIILTAVSLYWFMFVIFVDFPYAPESVSSDTTNSFITEQTENSEIYSEATVTETKTESDTSKFYTETETEKNSGSGSSGNNIQHADSYTPATTEKTPYLQLILHPPEKNLFSIQIQRYITDQPAVM